jgi:EAL domain-containing protein (putative c-di-GMP-specific phosphodiesterase class I)
MGITFAQGYAIHRPEPFDEIMADHKIRAEA